MEVHVLVAMLDVMILLAVMNVFVYSHVYEIISGTGDSVICGGIHILYTTRNSNCGKYSDQKYITF